MKDGWTDRHTGLETDRLNLTFMLSLPAPIFLPAVPIKFSEKQQSSHYLYVREHKVREGTKSSWPQKRTLFVLNVPPYCTEVNWCLGGNLSLGRGLQAELGSYGPPTESLVVQWKQLTEALRGGICKAASLVTGDWPFKGVL